MKKRVLLLLLLLLIGCATTGPKVSEEEIEKLKAELEVKAFLRNARAGMRLMSVGVRILKNLPKEDTGETRSIYTGIVFSEPTSISRRAFGIDEEVKRGVLVAGIVRDSPADRAGLKAGDVIRNVDGKEVDGIDSLSNVIKVLRKAGRFVPIPYEPYEERIPGAVREAQGVPLNIEIIRDGKPLWLILLPELIPSQIDFVPVESSEINAFATPDNRVIVTYGMLRFVESDDELAVVVGHEIAHLTKRHIVKSIPTQIISILLGVLAEEVMAGTGDITAQAVRAPFSRELEREADYFGLLYVHKAGYDIRRGVKFWERFAIELPQSLSQGYLSTHPSSPERMLRLIKIVEELEANSNLSDSRIKD